MRMSKECRQKLPELYEITISVSTEECMQTKTTTLTQDYVYVRLEEWQVAYRRRRQNSTQLGLSGIC